MSDLAVSPQASILAPSGTRNSLAPRNLEEAMTFSKMLAGSSFVPKDFKDKPGDILVAIQWGMEIGLAPLQALQNIAVINGRPSIWGDAALALVQAHPEYVKHDEGIKGEGLNMVGWFTIVRKGHAPYTIEFSVADAQTASLWKKAGPWTTSPKRMLRLRARGFALRDKFADALKGIITREEAYDIPPSVTDAAAEESVAVFGREKALDWWKTWRTVGRRSQDEATTYLAEVMHVDSSEKIPMDREEEAYRWARGEKVVDQQVPAAAQPQPDDASAEVRNRIGQLFDIHGTDKKTRETLLADFADDLPGLANRLEENLPQDQ